MFLTIKGGHLYIASSGLSHVGFSLADMIRWLILQLPSKIMRLKKIIKGLVITQGLIVDEEIRNSSTYTSMISDYKYFSITSAMQYSPFTLLNFLFKKISHT